jgi:hypothetical protein
MGHESAFSRLELLARNFQFRVGQQRSLNLELLRRISLDYHLNVEAVAQAIGKSSIVITDHKI